MNRFFSFRLVVLATASLALLCAGPAAAQTTVPLRGSGVGQVIFQIDPTPDEPGLQVYAGEGKLTLVGHVTFIGVTLFTLDGDVSGEFVVTTEDGATMAGSYTGTWAPISETEFEFEIEAVWGDGTGRLAGITGESNGVAVLDGLTGVFDAEHNGVWTRP